MNKSILEVVHSTAKGLYNGGLLDKAAMEKFNAKCLPKNNKKHITKKTALAAKKKK